MPPERPQRAIFERSVRGSGTIGSREGMACERRVRQHVLREGERLGRAGRLDGVSRRRCGRGTGCRTAGVESRFLPRHASETHGPPAVVNQKTERPVVSCSHAASQRASPSFRSARRRTPKSAKRSLVNVRNVRAGGRSLSKTLAMRQPTLPGALRSPSRRPSQVMTARRRSTTSPARTALAASSARRT